MAQIRSETREDAGAIESVATAAFLNAAYTDHKTDHTELFVGGHGAAADA